MYEPKKKPGTVPEPSAALTRLMLLCSRSEKCTDDIRRLLERWEVAEECRDEIIGALTAQKYLDDRRYARAFARDKLTYNRWGRQKIYHALRMKGIPSADIVRALEEMPDNLEAEQLETVLRRKRASVKAENEYRLKEKLVRHALSKGFELDDILRAVDGILSEK